MIDKLRNLWFTLRSSLWFVPTLMVSSAIALSFLTILLDEAMRLMWLRDFDSVYSGGPEGARAVLATIAGSTIGVTGVAFSITIVTLTLASSQFGHRLLRNFMRDLGNQIVLGTVCRDVCLLLADLTHGTRCPGRAVCPPPLDHVRTCPRSRESRRLDLFHPSCVGFNPSGHGGRFGESRSPQCSASSVSGGS